MLYEMRFGGIFGCEAIGAHAGGATCFEGANMRPEMRGLSDDLNTRWQEPQVVNFAAACARRLLRLFLLCLGIMVISASMGEAATYCLYSGTASAIPHTLVVLKNFKKPARGSCAEFAGYEGSGTVAIPATVTACLNSAGNRLDLSQTVHTFIRGEPIDIAFLQIRMGLTFPYPSLTGAVIIHQYSDAAGYTASSGPVPDSYLKPCSPFPMP
jgi:hypothetical protein